MKLSSLDLLPEIPKMKLAVVGHVEWVTFLKVDALPEAGKISHAEKYLEGPAGGGAVIAAQIAKLIKQRVLFITSLGEDYEGYESEKKLNEMGLDLRISWRNSPTRKGISFIDNNKDRAITVIGDRLEPKGDEDLDWLKLNGFDGVFITAGDKAALNHCRRAKFMGVTPRVGLNVLNGFTEKIDLLVGSALDPQEQVKKDLINNSTKLIIATEGEKGGETWPNGRYEAINMTSPIIDSYGCGDNFAAGVTVGLAAGWSVEESISLGAYCGSICASQLGPYGKLDTST